MSGEDNRTAVTTVTDLTRPVPEQVASDCLVVIYRRSGEAGKCFKLTSSPIRIGRASDNEIALDDQGVSRRHARLERREHGVVVMDVGSRNGTLLNDRELTCVQKLENGDRIKIGSTIFKYLSGHDIEAAWHEQIFKNSITDNLTQLFNKRHWDDELAREFSRSRRHARPLSLLIIDVDHFKRVNDTHGHHVGDIALAAVANVIRTSMRTEAVLARFGGEEMVALLPETDLQSAVELADKLRQAVAVHEIAFRDVRLFLTVSIGCAELQASDEEPVHFFERCDAKLYVAKETGRNCVKW